MSLLARTPLWGLDPHRAVTQYIHKKWTIEDGLPNNMIYAILQTRDGYLWVGTNNGLVRFDGVKFEIFNRDNTPAMPDNRVTDLLETRNGSLWAATRGGLVIYNNGKFYGLTTQKRLLKPVVQAIAEDRDGHIWAGFRGKGLNIFINGDFTSPPMQLYFKENPSTNELFSTVSDFCLDKEGNMWIGTVTGLFRVIKGKPVKVDIKKRDGKPVRRISGLFSGDDGDIWAATLHDGIFRYNPRNRTCTFFGRRDGLHTNYINDIYKDRDGIIWICSEGYGLYRLLPGKQTGWKADSLSVFSKKDGLTDNSVYHVYEDRMGNLWVGTYSGLNLLRNGKIVSFTEKEGLLDNVTWTIFQDRAGALWVTTNKGLNRFRNRRFTAFEAKDGLASDFVSCSWEDYRGNLWIGTYDKGLCRLTNGKFSIISKKSGFNSNSVRAIQEDSGKKLWVGTYGRGIFIMDPIKSPGKFTRYPSPGYASPGDKRDKLSSDHVFVIYEDRAGRMWIGTDGGGLNMIKGDTVTIYTKRNGLSSDTVTAILEDGEKDGSFWIGTENNGLNYLDTSTGGVRRITVKDGLKDSTVYHIIEDKKGFFWMSGNKGITRLNKKQCADFISGKIFKVNAKLLGKGDGMKSTSCNGTFQPAGWMDSSGKIWFPTSGGIVRADPDNFEAHNTPEPPVYIEKIVVDGGVVNPGAKLVLEPGIRKVDIHYTAISLADPRDITFKTRLEGFDAQWQATGDRKDRIATYTSIPHGDYIFRVTAGSGDGVWNKKGASIYISVNAPFWLQWWFLLAAAVVFALLSYLVISYLKVLLKMVRFWKKKNYIGNYKLVDQIGSGGMAMVYKAETRKGSKKSIVALKLMKDEYIWDDTYRKRFLTEGRIIDKMDHPHIVKVFDRGEHNHRLYIVMELLDGTTLDRVIAENAPMAVDRCLHVVLQVLEALVKIHGAGIIHRDMKPGNIFVENRKDGYFVKILDFGLAKSEAASRVTETGMVVGTLNYLSPEQLLDSRYSRAGDIYALGIIFYQLLSGKEPYHGETALERIRAILKEPVKEVKTIAPNIPDKLNRLVKIMMSKEPEMRPNAEELLLSLKKLASG